MATRQRGTKRSMAASTGIGTDQPLQKQDFVFAPNVDLNSPASIPAPPGANPAGAADNHGYIANGMDPSGTAVVSMDKAAGGGTTSTGKKNDRRHRCHMCGKMFNRPSSLKIHLTTHTGERPFPCPYPGCGRAFNVSSNMRRHFRTHNTNGEAGTPLSAPATGFASQQQQQQHPQQQAQAAWNVNMYNPGAGMVQGQMQAPRQRMRRSKDANTNQYENGNDAEGSEDADGDGEQDQGQSQQNLHGYVPFGAPPGMYGGFPPAPIMNIPGLPGMPDMPGMPDIHSMQGVPMGMQMMPIEMAFPVDPALTGQNADTEADADADGNGDADADADAEEDADGENDGEGDGEGEGEEPNRPQLTHSTSNTRASTHSTTSKTRSSARVQAKAKAAGSPSSNTRGRGRPPKTTNQASSPSTSQQQQQVQFRQILVPVSVPLSNDPAQASRIAQQYQHQYAQYAKYAQYAQYYMQHQQSQAGQIAAQQGAQTQSSMAPQTPMSTDTSVQRPGPATSAERTSPSSAGQISQGTTGPGDSAGRNVFVHWGQRADPATKEAKGVADVATVPASSGMSLATDATGQTNTNEGLEGSAAIEGLAADGKDCAAGSGSNAGVDATGNVQERRNGSRGVATASPIGDADGGVDEEGDEAAEEPGKSNQASSPRKRRKVARGRGRGRR